MAVFTPATRDKEGYLSPYRAELRTTKQLS